MVTLGFIESQGVLAALGRVQDARLAETARFHAEGLSVALGPSVLRQEAWEVYDILDRARSASDGQRLLLSMVADERGRILAATDLPRAPVGDPIAGFERGAVAPEDIRMTGEPALRVVAPTLFQGREVGSIVTELDVTDLLAERCKLGLWLLTENAATTTLLAFAGWLAVARILRPVGVLVQAMDDAKSAPRPIAKASIPRGDPGFARLIATYNEMTATVERRAEAERRLAERERFVSLGRLSSSLAHEINNTLGGLLNAADTIRTYADRPEVVRQSAELVQRGLARLRDVTRAMLDQNRPVQAGQFLRPEDFEDLRLLFEPEVASRTQTMDWQIAAPAPVLAVLPAAPVRQIVLNLPLNAGAAAGARGHVGLQVAQGPDSLVLSADDSGPGFQPDDLARLMGAGPLPAGGSVGLRLVRDLVAAQGGTIRHDRAPGRTTITVTLPRREAVHA
jgi:signal transduction histidine kinase